MRGVAVKERSRREKETKAKAIYKQGTQDVDPIQDAPIEDEEPKQGTKLDNLCASFTGKNTDTETEAEPSEVEQQETQVDEPAPEGLCLS